MSISPTRTETAAPPASLRLTSWPLVDERPTAVVIVLIVLLIPVVVANVTASSALGLISVAVLLLSSWRMWLPISWEFGPSGVTQRLFRRQRLVPWKRFSRYEIFGRGVLLLQNNERGLTRIMNGLYIACGERREELLSLLQHYLRDSERP